MSGISTNSFLVGLCLEAFSLAKASVSICLNMTFASNFATEMFGLLESFSVVCINFSHGTPRGTEEGNEAFGKMK